MNIFDLLILQPIFNLLIGLYAIIPGSDFGISIILFTIIVRFALYPLVKKQLHQTQAMRRLQPQLKKIKAQSKGNKQQASLQMMELYKEHGVNPFRSLGLLLIQLPIFIALFSVIRIFTQHLEQVPQFTYNFLEGIGPIKQIIEKPEQFNETLFGIIDLTKSAITTNGIDFFLVGLAVIAGVTQYIMTKQTMPQSGTQRRLRDIMAEAAEGKEADQSEMNEIVMMKMMKVMPIFMFFIMVSLPGALALYYVTSNIVAVLQQAYLLRKDEFEINKIASEPLPRAKQPAKKATVKAREKAAQPAKVTEPTVTRITAKSTPKKEKK